MQQDFAEEALVPEGNVADLTSLEIAEASKYLFGQVNWQEYIRAGVFLSQNEVSTMHSCRASIA